jgi:hypothetical protein
MKAIILSIILLPLGLVAAQAPHQLTVNNYSDQDITVYYHNNLHAYVTIKALEKKKIITVSPFPQIVTVHFNRLDVQQDIHLTDAEHPVTIYQHNKISVKQNGQPISPTTHFSSHNPRMSAYQDN